MSVGNFLRNSGWAALAVAVTALPFQASAQNRDRTDERENIRAQVEQLRTERRSEQRSQDAERRGDRRAEQTQRQGDWQRTQQQVERRGQWQDGQDDRENIRRQVEQLRVDRERSYRDGDRDRRWRDGDRDRQWRDNDRRWDRRWRDNNRYDWRRWRDRNRSTFSIGVYYAPYRNYRYRRLGIGYYLDSLFYRDRYWLNDPWQYRLPNVYGPYRWVRYYDDVLLVDIYSGEVVDVIYDFFW